MLKRESPVLLLIFLRSWMWDFNQLGVEFGSKLIKLPDDNKVVKLQCEFEAVDICRVLCLTIVNQVGTLQVKSHFAL